MPRKPLRSYMICTAPRSGSTLLCKLLAASNIAGIPDSHFHEPSLDDWLADYSLAAQDFETSHDVLRRVFQSAIARGKGETDVFGLRMQRRSFDFFIQQLEQLHSGKLSDVERIESAFGPTLFVHLSRHDRVDQAISLVRAEQTGLWHRRSDGTELERLGPPQDAHYDADAIKHHMAELASFDRAWEAWFDLEELTPLRISYDNLTKDPQAVLAQVLSALSLDPTSAYSVATPTAKLADATNRTWKAQFESEN
jgi:trehalose 2-sulfotransferase